MTKPALPRRKAAPRNGNVLAAPLPPEPSMAGLLYSVRRPRGLAGLITPWNFPLAILLWKAVPALAFGNAVLLKPAPEATARALRLAEIKRAWTGRRPPWQRYVAGLSAGRPVWESRRRAKKWQG